MANEMINILPLPYTKTLQTGRVFDSQTGQALPYANITLVNGSGGIVDTGVAADREGKFRFDSLAFPGNYIMVSYAGYNPGVAAAEDLPDYVEVQLSPGGDLAPVVVTPKNNQQKETPWIWIAAGAAGLLLLVNSKKRK